MGRLSKYVPKTHWDHVTALATGLQLWTGYTAMKLRHLLLGRKAMTNLWVGKIPWRRKWQPTPVLLPGESHGQRSPADYSPQGHKELDMTESLLQHHSSKASVLQHSAFFTVQLSHPYMTTGKTIVLTRRRKHAQHP